MNSIIGLTKYIADTDTQLPDMTYWQLGSIAKVTYPTLMAIAPIMIISGAVLIIMRWRINILSLGDNEARSLGVNLRFERGIAIICSTVLTASAVCMSGTIGWIGLVMPHLGRMVVGSNNVRLLPRKLCELLHGFGHDAIMLFEEHMTGQQNVLRLGVG